MNTYAVVRAQPILYMHVIMLVILWMDLKNKTHKNVKKEETRVVDSAQPNLPTPDNAILKTII